MRKLLIATPPIVLATLLVVSASGCASASKPKPSDQPGLVIPPPPPHVVSITPEPVVEPVAEAPAPPAPGGNPARNAGRGNRDLQRPPGSETKPAGTTAEVTPPLPDVPAPPAGPPPQLRAADSPATEATVRATVDRARRMLATIDYRRLTKERQKAYDDAKRFADQADEALKQGNVVFAQGVAGKAETLARELAAR